MAKYEVRLDWWVASVCTVEVEVPDGSDFEAVKAEALRVANEEGGYDNSRMCWDACTETFVGDITPCDGAPAIEIPDGEDKDP